MYANKLSDPDAIDVSDGAQIEDNAKVAVLCEPADPTLQFAERFRPLTVHEVLAR